MYRWIKKGLLDQPLETIRARYGPRAPAVTKLERFTGIIQARLAEYPRLSGTRLLAEVRAAGYAGGITQLRDYVRAIDDDYEKFFDCLRNRGRIEGTKLP